MYSTPRVPVTRLECLLQLAEATSRDSTVQMPKGGPHAPEDPAPQPAAKQFAQFPVDASGRGDDRRQEGGSAGRDDKGAAFIARVSLDGGAVCFLGWVSFAAPQGRGGRVEGLYQYASILYHLTTAGGLGSGARSGSEKYDVKFEFPETLSR